MMPLCKWKKTELRDRMVFWLNFTKKFWGMLKDDLLMMFKKIHSGDLPLYHINCGTIVLLPKQ
jgi:hypothetical protein